MQMRLYYRTSDNSLPNERFKIGKYYHSCGYIKKYPTNFEEIEISNRKLETEYVLLS